MCNIENSPILSADKNIQVGTILPSTVKEGNPEKLDSIFQELGCIILQSVKIYSQFCNKCQNCLVSKLKISVTNSILC